jgi:hypothetical protein
MLVMSGNEILMDRDAELSPIDPQMRTPNGGTSPAVARVRAHQIQKGCALRESGIGWRGKCIGSVGVLLYANFSAGLPPPPLRERILAL